MIESLTFFLAMLGYAVLAVSAGVTRSSKRLIRATAAIVVLHVLLVWWFRYDWSVAAATRNGYGGFLLFHAALVMILWATVAPAPLSRRLIIGAFAIVSVGALGAVFRYDVVRIYRIPVILCAIAGTIGALRRHHES